MKQKTTQNLCNFFCKLQKKRIRHGVGVKKDYSKPLKYYLKSVELGNVDALNTIGVIYYNGYGVEQNYSNALDYF